MERDKKGGGIWTCLHLQWLRVALSHYAYWDGYTQNLVRNGLMDLNKNYGYIHIYIIGFCHCSRSPRQLAIYKIWEKMAGKAIGSVQ